MTNYDIQHLQKENCNYHIIVKYNYDTIYCLILSNLIKAIRHVKLNIKLTLYGTVHLHLANLCHDLSHLIKTVTDNREREAENEKGNQIASNQ